MDVRNCKNCGRLFNYVGKTICPECIKEREDEFTTVKNYIRDNPGVGVAAVSEATGVTVNQIRQWIREERLVLTATSAGDGINCEGCGRPILSGRMCESCKKQMSNDLSHAFAQNVPQPEKKVDPKDHKNKMRFLNQ